MELRQYLNIFRKSIWLLILLPVIITVVFAVVSVLTYRPVYEAYSTLYIIDKNTNMDSPLTYQDIIVYDQLVKDYRVLVKSRLVAKEVIEEMDIKDLSPERLAANINISSKNDTRVLELRVKDYNPRRAKMLTDKVGEIFIKKAVSLMNVNNINIVDYAEVPLKPAKSKTALNSSICFFVSIFLLAGIVILKELVSNTIKTIDDVEYYLKLNVLGVIPSFEIE